MTFALLMFFISYFTLSLYIFIGIYYTIFRLCCQYVFREMAECKPVVAFAYQFKKMTVL